MGRLRLRDKVKVLARKPNASPIFQKCDISSFILLQSIRPAQGTPHSLRSCVDPWDTESAIPKHNCKPVPKGEKQEEPTPYSKKQMQALDSEEERIASLSLRGRDLDY